MTIQFKSTYGIEDTKEEIAFRTKLKKSLEKDINILEFVEPSNNIQNRIEYTNTKVSIYAGPTTIDLELNKKIKNNFVTEHGTIIIISILQSLIIEKDIIKINYTLNDNNNNLINIFEIELSIFES